MSSHKSAQSLSAFNPLEHGDVVVFSNGSKAQVSQSTSKGWFLMDGSAEICVSGFHMQSLIRAVLAEDEARKDQSA